MSVNTFHIHAVAGKNLVALDMGGTSDPFLRITTDFNKQKFKSKRKMKTLAPAWDEEFEFFTSRTAGNILVQVMDWNRFGKNDFMGDVTLRLEDYMDGKKDDKWFPLGNEPQDKRKGSKEVGELHLKVWVTKAGEVTNSTAVGLEDNYKVGPKLGKGAFSEVKLVTHKKSGLKYAAKCIDKASVAKQLSLQSLDREIDIMKKLKHPGIICLNEVINTPKTLYLILEFAPGGELYDAVEKNGGTFNEPEAAGIIKQILEACAYIHQNGVAHRDLKPENILIISEEGKMNIKIADFGLSKDFGVSDLHTCCGTPDYVAPEVLEGGLYTESVDIWSVGVISYVLLSGSPPFYGSNRKQLFARIMTGTYDFNDPEWNTVSEGAKDFIKGMLVVNPENRKTIEECLNHEWLKDALANPEKYTNPDSFNLEKFKEYTKQRKESRLAEQQQ